MPPPSSLSHSQSLQLCNQYKRQRLEWHAERRSPLPNGLSGVLNILVPAVPAICTPFFSDFLANFCHVACLLFCSFAFAALTSNFFSFFFFFFSLSSSSALVNLRLFDDDDDDGALEA